MRIYIEGSAMMNRRSGIGQFAKRLAEAVSAVDKKNRYTIFSFRFYVSRRPLELPITKRANLNYHLIRWLPAVIYFQLFKRFIVPPIDWVLGRRPDIMFFPNFVSWPVYSKKTKVIAVIHDLSFVHYGQYASPQNRDYMLKFVPRTIARVDHLLTISENSKKEIIEHYKVEPEKISIVTPSIDHSEYFPRSDKEIESVKEKYGISGNFLLFTSTLEPRKNVHGILDAYAALPESIRNQYSLVLAGMKGWVDSEIQDRLDRYKNLDIIRTGYVDDADLPALFSGATLFLFPSFYEGFGIPPLEAMACGTPVISSNNSSLPEVIGDAGVLLDDLSASSISRSIEALLEDRAAQKRYRQLGLKQASRFSWEKSAKDLVAVFNRIGKQDR